MGRRRGSHAARQRASLSPPARDRLQHLEREARRAPAGLQRAEGLLLAHHQRAPGGPRRPAPRRLRRRLPHHTPQPAHRGPSSPAAPYVELNKSSYIVGSSRLHQPHRLQRARAGCPGAKNTLAASVFPHGKEKSKSDVLYTAEARGRT
ncbi:hypothetical protein EPUL_006572, partial [Erysiphe pulchra]